MLISVSASHHTAQFATLERLAELPRIADALKASHSHIRGAVVLATCNRFEAYLDVEEDSDDSTPEPAVTSVLHTLSELSAIPYRQLADEVSFAHGHGVARHLFAVSSGLESVAIGEGEIAGQVRRALDQARQDGLTTASLEQLFQRATETSKRVKGSTALTESGRSLVRLALELAGSRLNDWSQARVLLIGTGRYAAVTLASLRALGAEHIGVASESRHGEQFARTHDVALVDDFGRAVVDADVIISCTTRDTFALLPEDFGGREAADLRPQLVIDLGLPRNVDPAVASLAHISLLDLETIRLHAPIDEFAHLATAREIVDIAARRFGSQQRGTAVADAVVAVRSTVLDLVDAELARLKAPDESVRIHIEESLRHFAGVLLHRISQAGRNAAAAGRAEAWSQSASEVFGSGIASVEP